MMDDIYLEYMIKKKKKGWQKALIAALIIFASLISIALLILMYVMMLAFFESGYREMIPAVGLLIIAGMCYGTYLIIGMQNVEYEYILTNSEMDIDKVMSKKGRKHIVTFDFKEISICANICDDEHNHDYKNVTPNKIYDLIGDNSGDNIYFADFAEEGGSARVLFQPSYKMITSAKKFNPRNIFVMEE